LSAAALLEARGTIQGSNPTAWTAFSTSVAVLVTAGVVSPASVAAIGALRTPTVPVWPVVLTADDVIAARSLT
jgi:hypothetical protein